MKKDGIGIFLISHDIHDVFDLADRVTVMKNGKVVGSGRTSDMSKDEVLGMIILGKCPPGATPGRVQSRRRNSPRSAMAEPASDRSPDKRGRSVPDLDAVREANRARIVAAIREAGAIARVEISDRTGISPATVSVITGQLLEDGVIEHDVEAVEGGDVPRGRPRAFLRLNPRAAYAVGIKLAKHRIFVSLTDFRGEIVAFNAAPLIARQLHTAMLARVCAEAVERLIAEAGISLAGSPCRARHRLSPALSIINRV